MMKKKKEVAPFLRQRNHVTQEAKEEEEETWSSCRCPPPFCATQHFPPSLCLWKDIKGIP